MSGLPVARISERLLGKPWPGVGEMPVVVAASSRPPREPAATTLRSVVLEPERHVGRGVTLTGRFRGRNLYGDMPEAPEESRWDFVLRSARRRGLGGRNGAEGGKGSSSICCAAPTPAAGWR